MKINAESIIICGDIHGAFGELNSLINQKHPDIIICCGDFGYWEGYIEKIKPQTTKIFWAPGNHCHWWELLRKYPRNALEPIEMLPDNLSNVFYCPIGSSLELNSERWLFAGGADSIDKCNRTMGIDWFPEEVMNHGDFEFIVDANETADVIVSHTVPVGFDPYAPKHFSEIVDLGDTVMKYNDPTCMLLTELREIYRPKRWYAGHWHTYIQRVHKWADGHQCIWTVLDYPRHGGKWWTEELVTKVN